MSKLNYFMGAVGAILLASCSAPPGESAFSTAPVRIPEVKSTTELLFINGKEFCSEYKEITAKEYGKYITVPKDYNDPSKGTLEIYAYTMKPFNPDLPTYIYVDGGPGQNTHGMMPDYFDDRMNEIRFDQRGLGCSTPETYELYKSAYLYSSENNVRDMDAIRHSYGIKEWSVYGVSYGTVPATMYGSKFPEQTVSVVLEGVVGRTELLTQNRYKADKLNLVLAQLTPEQRVSFGTIVFEESEDTSLIFSLLFRQFYSEAGLRKAVTYLKLFIEDNGTIRRELLKQLRDSASASNQFKLPQQPGAVDQNIQIIIYCRDLDARAGDGRELSYMNGIGFYEIRNSMKFMSELCEKAGVLPADETPFNVNNYPITKPVYYFQGSHDGATIAEGALEHWRLVPKGKSYFMLAQKGGHNPNLSRLEGMLDLGEMDPVSAALKQTQLAGFERVLFENSILARPINLPEVAAVNDLVPVEQKWLLYTELPGSFIDINKELDGIRRLSMER